MKPRVLMLYYSFTNQTRQVADAMADSFRECGCEAETCCIEFPDDRYTLQLPVKPFLPKMLRLLVPQLLGRTGEIRVPEEVLDRDYDLICIGSPTWWFNPAMPIVSFLKSESSRKLLDGKSVAAFVVCRALWRYNLRKVKKLTSKQGANFLRGAAFRFQGNQIQSMLSFINYLVTGKNRDRYLGISLYEFGISEDGIEKSKEFARQLAGTLVQQGNEG